MEDGQLVIRVNVDIAFLLNFVADLAWLSATGSLAGVRTRGWRLVLTSALGAAAAVWTYFDSGRWLATGPGLLLGTAALLALAFWPCRVQQALRVLAYCVLTGAAMAGTALLVSLRAAAPGPLSGLTPGELPGTLVAAGIFLCALGGRHLWAAARDRARLARGLYTLRVTVRGQTQLVMALLDTGNSLRDPLTGTPVAVVEASALERLVPPEVMRVLPMGWEGLDSLPGTWAARCRMVPYRAVGEPSGVLLAFTPDELAVQGPGAGEWLAVRGLVGLAGGRLHPEGAYRALLSPELAGAEGVA